MSQLVQVQAGQDNVSLLGRMLTANDKFLLSDAQFERLGSGVYTSILSDLGPGLLVAPVTLANITANAQEVASWTPGFEGVVHSFAAVVTTAVTTAAKSATLGLFIDEDGSTGTNEVQTVTITGTPTGGTFTLTYAGQTTATIAYNANAAAVQSALEALSNIAPGDVLCAGGALPGTPVTVTFQGALADTDVALMTADGSGLTGGSSPAVAVTQTTAGVAGTGTATRVGDVSLALTSANATPASKIVPASNVVGTAANPARFGKNSVISVRTIAAPTAFSEGAILLVVLLEPFPRV